MECNKSKCSSLEVKLSQNFLDGAWKKIDLEVIDLSTKANISVNANFSRGSKKSNKKRKEKSELKLTESLSLPEVTPQPVNESGSLVDKVSKSIEPTKDANTVLKHSRSISNFIASPNRKFDSDLASVEFAFRRKIDNITSRACKKTNEGDECNEESLNPTSFISPYKSHSAKNLTVCSDSQKVISHEDHVERNKRTLILEKEFACNRCERRFKQIFNFTRHYRTHTNEKPFFCEICGKGFSQKNSLILHKRTHTGEKPYECDLCEKRFNHKSHLVTHHRIHTGEKPYECGICKKGFRQTSHLIAHTRIHTNEMPFGCDLCERRFKNRSSLMLHLRKHNSEKP